jgi:IclR family pca regulon transcriptional regulator
MQELRGGIKPVDFVESFSRGLAVLRAFGPGRERLTLSDVAKSCNLERSASRRFLLTLCALGYAVQEQRYFRLTPKVLEIGYGFLSGLRFPELISPVLTQVTAQLGESCSAAILDGSEIVYIARSAAPSRLMSVALNIGSRLPAHATAMGHALLAFLPPPAQAALLAALPLPRFTPHTITSATVLKQRLDLVARRGYAINDQELEEGLRSLAVPVPGANGQVNFVINLAVNANRVSIPDLEARCLPVLLEAVALCGQAVQNLPDLLPQKNLWPTAIGGNRK